MAEEYEHSVPVTLFTFTSASAADSAPAVILIPSVANRQNFITTAQAFSQIAPDTTEVQFTPEIKAVSYTHLDVYKRQSLHRRKAKKKLTGY